MGHYRMTDQRAKVGPFLRQWLEEVALLITAAERRATPSEAGLPLGGSVAAGDWGRDAVDPPRRRRLRREAGRTSGRAPGR